MKDIRSIEKSILNDKSINNASFNSDEKNSDVEELELNSLNQNSINKNHSKSISTIQKAGATTATIITSIAEGLGELGEAIVDTAAISKAITDTPVKIIADGTIIGSKSIVSSIKNNENIITSIKNNIKNYDSLLEKTWDDTKSFVAKEYVKSAFNSFYESKSGNNLKENAYGFDTIRNVGSGVGYVGGIVAISVATFGIGGAAIGGSAAATTATTSGLSATMAGVAATAGFGKGTQDSWNDGASIVQGLAYGTSNAAWEGAQFYIGGEINGLTVGKNAIANAGVRVGLDSLTGASEGLARPALQKIYKDESYSELFNQAGGWKNVGIQAGMAAGMSSIGEASGLAKKFRGTDNISSSFEKIEVKNLDLENMPQSRKFDTGHLYNTFKEYDNIYTIKNNINDAIKDINTNNSLKKNLIVLDNTSSLTEDIIKKLPDNTEIRLTGGYTDDYLKGFKIGASGEKALEHVTFNKNELMNIVTEIKKFDEGINPNWSEIEKAKYAYDYLNKNLKYNADPGGSMIRAKEYDGILSLVKGESTCQGFAETYKQLLDRMGIKCTTIGGSLTGEGQHAYTIVSIGDNSFIVDVVRPSIKATYGESGFAPNPSMYTAKNNSNLLEQVKNNYTKNTQINHYLEKINKDVLKENVDFVNEKGLLDVKKLPLSSNEGERIVQQKLLNGEELSLNDRLKLRDRAVTKIDNIDLRSDCVYRATDSKALDDYVKKGVINDIENNAKRESESVHWYLGGTSTRYGKIIIEAPANPSKVSLTKNYGGLMSGNPNIRHVITSQENAISLDEVSRIIFLDDKGQKVLKIIEPNNSSNLIKEVELGKLLYKQDHLLNIKTASGDSFTPEMQTQLDEINAKLRSSKPYKNKIEEEIDTITIDKMISNTTDEAKKSVYQEFKDGQEFLSDVATQEGFKDLKSYGRQGKIVAEDFSDDIQKVITEETNNILNKAKRCEPTVTKDMRSLEHDNLFLFGEDNKLKSKSRLEEKLITKASEVAKKNKLDITIDDIRNGVNEVGDSLRYTLITDDDLYVDKITSSLNKLENNGYKVTKFRNTWEEGSRYMGVNCNLEKQVGNDSISIELQFHTPESYKIKGHMTHDVYEVMTNESIPTEYTKLAEKLQEKLSATLNKPKGIENYDYLKLK